MVPAIQWFHLEFLSFSMVPKLCIQWKPHTRFWIWLFSPASTMQSNTGMLLGSSQLVVRETAETVLNHVTQPGCALGVFQCIFGLWCFHLLSGVAGGWDPTASWGVSIFQTSSWISDRFAAELSASPSCRQPELVHIRSTANWSGCLHLSVLFSVYKSCLITFIGSGCCLMHEALLCPDKISWYIFF